VSTTKFTAKLRCAVLRYGPDHDYRVLVRTVPRPGSGERQAGRTYGTSVGFEELQALALDPEVMAVDLSEATRPL